MAAPPGSSIGSSSTKFNPSDFLKGLGWKGEGLGREQTGRVKHVTVAKKSSLSGVGKDRDTAFPWWEMVFKNVAGKVGGAGSDDPHHRTATGIISHRPPRPKADDYIPSSASTSGTSTPNTYGGINRDAFALAQQEQVRRQLYSSFLRGKGGVGGTAEAAAAASESMEGDLSTKKRKSNKSEASQEAKRIRKAIRAKRREQRALSNSASGTATPAEASPTPPPVPSSNKRPSSSSSTTKPSKRAKSALAEHLSPEESIQADETAYSEARTAAQRAEKEEKRLRRAIKKALEVEEGA